MSLAMQREPVLYGYTLLGCVVLAFGAMPGRCSFLRVTPGWLDMVF